MLRQQMMEGQKITTTKVVAPHMIGMEIFMFLLLALIIVAVVLTCYYLYKNRDKLKSNSNSINSSDKKDTSTNDNMTALEILNRKFVNGEITEEEYLRKKELITK